MIKEIEEKGILWIVSSNGDIAIHPHAKVYFTKRGGPYTSTFKGGIIKPYIQSNGYLSVETTKTGRRVRVSVHRLIGIAFVDGYSEELTINHINGNKIDNRIENLEWVTLAENTRLQWKTNLVNLRGEKHPCSKLTSKNVNDIKSFLSNGRRVVEIAKQFNVSTATIYKINKGKRWNHLINS